MGYTAGAAEHESERLPWDVGGVYAQKEITELPTVLMLPAIVYYSEVGDLRSTGLGTNCKITAARGNDTCLRARIVFGLAQQSRL